MATFLVVVDDAWRPHDLSMPVSLSKGRRAQLELDPQESLVLPPDIQGKVELEHIVFGNFVRTLCLRALEDVAFEPEALIMDEDREAFEAYRADLQRYLEYRAQLSLTYDELG